MEDYNNSAQSNFNKEEAYFRAKKKLDKLKGFYWHLASYVAVNIFLIVMVTKNLDSDESIWQFKTFATAIFWGIGLAFHAMGVFGPDLFFGKNWEQRKIDEYMDKDKRNWE
ncbi:2TM domain-containing protein [Flavobacteriaceae bacterium AH-315-B10]|nr:2TM domain-containing protein [Flavobacteriaceae bacterium AH-315-B10]